MVTEINPDAWDIAMQLDLERKSGNVRGFVLQSHLRIDVLSVY